MSSGAAPPCGTCDLISVHFLQYHNIDTAALVVHTSEILDY